MLLVAPGYSFLNASQAPMDIGPNCESSCFGDLFLFIGVVGFSSLLDGVATCFFYPKERRKEIKVGIATLAMGWQ